MLKTLQGFTVLILVTTLTSLTSCTSSTVRNKDNPSSISVMSYNLENLFDTQHDEGKNDYTFLPKSLKKADLAIEAGCEDTDSAYRKDECLNTDWNDKILDLKMKRLADTILAVNGIGPDILIVEEVENIHVLNQLNSKYLAKANYQTVVLIEGEDKRGIDVGLLSRLPLAGTAKLNPIEFTPDKKDPNWTRPLTRGILEVPLKLPTGETLTVFGFHMPSQGAPTQMRKDAIVSLNKLMDKRDPNTLAIAGGDCNVSAKEEAVNHLQRDLMGSKWGVSHYIGCKDCVGTEYYHGIWSFFDVLLFSPQLMSGKASYQLKTSSISIPQGGKYQLKIDGTPARFDATGSVGVTDHLPIYAELIRLK